MHKQRMKKLLPPWVAQEEKRSWYMKRSPEDSLNRLEENVMPYNCKKDTPKEDSRLKNWDKWLTERKNQQKQLKKRSGRESCNLTINSGEHERLKNEQREIIALAEELKIPDKNRGGLDFWGFPVAIGGKCKEQSLFAQQTKIQKGLLPCITKTGVPKIINKEKGIFDEKEKLPRNNFAKSPYKLQREKELKKKIDIILPHTPEFDELIVLGQKPQSAEDGFISLGPQISISCEKDDMDFLNTPVETLVENIVALRVNKTLLINEPPGKVATYLRSLIETQKEDYGELKNEWSMQFVSKPYELITQTISLHNMGTVAIKYYWKKVDLSVRYMKKRLSSPAFFFNKTEEVLNPNEEKIVKIWFYTSDSLIHKECWNLITYPKVVQSDNKIKFYFDGLSLEEPHPVQKTLHYINRRVAIGVARSLLHHLLITFTTENLLVVNYEHLSDEAYLFCLRNPQYYYHQRCVKKLREMYQKLTALNASEDDEFKLEPWDLSLRAIRNLIIRTRIPNKDHLFKELQELIRNLSKPVFHFVVDNKYSIVRSLLCNFFVREREKLRLLYLVCTRRVLGTTYKLSPPNQLLERRWIQPILLTFIMTAFRPDCMDFPWEFLKILLCKEEF